MGATPDVTIAPKSSAGVRARVIDPANEPTISAEEKLQLIRRHIKYVFVLFQENRSFDFYFGSYPGADGLYAGPNGPYALGQVAGFTQTIVNTDGTLGTVTPFKIPATVTDASGKTVPLYPADIASVNHSHVAIARKIALDADGVAQNSEYALTEEGVTLVDGKPSKIPTLERKQFGELVMSHVDCDTVPVFVALCGPVYAVRSLYGYDRWAIDAECDCNDFGTGRRDAVDAASGRGDDRWHRDGCDRTDAFRSAALLGIGAGYGEPAEAASGRKAVWRRVEEPDVCEFAAFVHGQQD